MNEEEKLKDLKAVYSGAVQSGEIGIANMIKGGIDLIEKLQKECIFREDGAEEGLWHCSNCHDEWLFYEGTPEDNELKYCPHCGAKVIKYESYIEGQIEIANKMEEDYLKERKQK